MCGAANDEQKCERIYDNKWSMYWEEFKEFAKTAMLIAFLLIFLILSVISMYWKIN